MRYKKKAQILFVSNTLCLHIRNPIRFRRRVLLVYANLKYEEKKIYGYNPLSLISSKYIPGIYLILYIIQTDIIAVGDDGMALCLESCQVIDNLAAEEGATLFECWFIDDDLCTLCLDTLHDALNCRLAEVIGIGFHCQAIDTDDA